MSQSGREHKGKVLRNLFFWYFIDIFTLSMMLLQYGQEVLKIWWVKNVLQAHLSLCLFCVRQSSFVTYELNFLPFFQAFQWILNLLHFFKIIEVKFETVIVWCVVLTSLILSSLGLFFLIPAKLNDVFSPLGSILIHAIFGYLRLMKREPVSPMHQLFNHFGL